MTEMTQLECMQNEKLPDEESIQEPPTTSTSAAASTSNITTDASPVTSTSTVEETAALSKNQIKRMAKRALQDAQKPLKRALEKARKAEKRKSDRLAGVKPAQPCKKALMRDLVQTPFGATIIMDCSFDSLHTERETISLANQLTFSYSYRRMCRNPPDLHLACLDGKLKSRLDAQSDAAYKRWQGTTFSADPYESAFDLRPDLKSKYFYLTSDTENVLTELTPGCSYIIGAICDHNRHKDTTVSKAIAQGITPVALPISEFIRDMPSRKVLTVNQVADILFKWADSRDWEQAFFSVIPRRKFHAESRKVRRAKRLAGKQIEGQVQDDQSEHLSGGDDEDDDDVAPETLQHLADEPSPNQPHVDYV